MKIETFHNESNEEKVPPYYTVAKVMYCKGKAIISTAQTFRQKLAKILFSPECGCEDITFYNDGSCECNGCGFVWEE